MKQSAKVVCLIVLYPKMSSCDGLFWSSGTFLGTEERIYGFFGTPDMLPDIELLGYDSSTGRIESYKVKTYIIFI